MRKTTLLCALLATALCGGAQAQGDVTYSLVTSADGLTNGGTYVLKYTGPGSPANVYIYEEAPHTCVNNNGWFGNGWDAATILGDNPGIVRRQTTGTADAPAFSAEETQYFFTLEAGENGTFAIKAASGNYVDGRDLAQVTSGKGVPVHTVSSTVNKSFFTFEWNSSSSRWNIGNGATSGRNYLNVGGVDNGCVTMWNSPNGNDKGNWQIYALMDDAVSVTVTSQVDLGGGDVRTYSTETLTSAVGATVAAPDITYLTLAEGQPSEVEVTEDGQTITFTYVQNLPFETTAVTGGSFPADAKWYGVDMHSNQTASNGGQYTWQYNAGDARLLTPGTAKALATGLPYEQQFCFDGNIVDGFKIYNRAAGAGMTLESTANNPTLTTSNANNLWKLVKSTVIDGAFCFQQSGGTQYLNHQTENNGALHVAKYWTAPDNGSSCRAFPAASFSYNYLSNFTTAPAGAVGGLTDENATAQAVEAVAAYEDNKFNSDYFADALAAVSAAAGDTVAFVPGAYYRLVNVGLANGTVTYADGAANLTGNITEADALAEPGTVIRFEPVEGVEGQYHLMVQGRYFGTTRGSVPVALTDAAGAPAYTIAKANVGGRFVIKDVTGGDQAYLNLQSSSRNVLGWNSGEDASRWYIVPATELTVALNSAEGSTWASLYLPFGVNLPDGLKAYTGTRNDEAQTVTLTAIDAVPAETGVILEGSEETYTLTIADVTADVAGNAFTGTNQQLTDIDKAAYYTLGYGSNGLGLYHPNETTLRANVAFMQAGAQGVQGYRLMLDGTTTGIEGAPTAGADKADTWYDLSGRRVTAPTKGVYIQNGRKVVVK